MHILKTLCLKQTLIRNYTILWNLWFYALSQNHINPLGVPVDLLVPPTPFALCMYSNVLPGPEHTADQTWLLRYIFPSSSENNQYSCCWNTAQLEVFPACQFACGNLIRHIFNFVWEYPPYKHNINRKIKVLKLDFDTGTWQDRASRFCKIIVNIMVHYYLLKFKWNYINLNNRKPSWPFLFFKSLIKEPYCLATIYMCGCENYHDDQQLDYVGNIHFHPASRTSRT